MTSWPLPLLEDTLFWTAPDPGADWMWPRASGRAGAPLRRLGADGRYELLGVLYRGGQAFVWAAQDRVSGPVVVVKTVRPESEDPAAATRLEREARILALVTGSPRVVPLIEWGPARPTESGGARFETELPWLALPYLPHQRLPRALDRHGGTLGVTGTLGLGRDLAEALAHIHRHGVVHRDLSPGNVLLTPSGVVLVDFGTAWAAAGGGDTEDAPPRTGVTVLNGRGITWGWAAPETTLAHPDDGDRPDRRPAGDVFAWGLHVFAAYTGRHPWSAGRLSLTDREQLEMYRLHDPADLTDLDAAPPELAELVSASLRDSPGDRPTADELLTRLPETGPEPDLGPGRPDRHREAGKPSEAVTRLRAADPPNQPEKSTPESSPTCPDRYRDGVEPSEAVTRLRGADPPNQPEKATSEQLRVIWAVSRPVFVAWVAALAVLAVLSGGLLVSVWWTRHEYAVGVEQGRVTIVDRSVRYFWGVRSVAITPTDVATDLLPADDLAPVLRRVPVDGIDAAQRLVATLRVKADKCSRSLAPPCPARTPTAPQVTANAMVRPYGNLVQVTWGSPDERAGVVTTLSVTPTDRTSWGLDCPTVITSSGSCTFQGEFGRDYQVRARAFVPGTSAAADTTSNTTTGPRPRSGSR